MPYSNLPYNEVRKYINIEFALRERNVDQNGDYIGYTMQEKKYRAR